MKAVLGIIVIVLIGFAGWWFLVGNDSTNETGDEVDLSQFGQPDPNLGEGDGGVIVEEPDRNVDADINEDVESDADMDDADDMDTEVDADAEIDTDASGDAQGSEKVFEVTGTNYEFSMETITVQEGDTVTINFRSAEGFHDWTIDEFDAKTSRVNAGGTTSVTFVADQAGTFEYYCSVGSHRALGMVGTLVVEEA